jgi:hypothetical protein
MLYCKSSIRRLGENKVMIRNATRRMSPYEPVISVLAVAGVFIILGVVIAITPDISQKTTAFFNNLTSVSYHLGDSSTLNLPVPANPSQHIGFFIAVMDFILGVGILQIIILPIRLLIKSSIRRIADAVGNLVFWLGGAVVSNVFLLAGTQTGWFQFWAWLILLTGLSLIARFLAYLINKSLFSRRHVRNEV